MDSLLSRVFQYLLVSGPLSFDAVYIFIYKISLLINGKLVVLLISKILKTIKLLRSVNTMFKDNNKTGIIIKGPEKRNDIVQPFITNYLEQFEEGTGSFHYDEKKQTITMSGKQNGYHVTLTAEKGLGETTTQTRYPVLDRKSEYKDEVLRLYNEKGLKQKDIASILNISQSLVSKLIRNNI